MKLPSFIKNLDLVSIASQIANINANKPKLETDEKLLTVDAVCEGPIEGLVDKDGNLLKYITDSDNVSLESLILGKGVYFNDVALLDSRLNKLNFVTQGFNISYGEEFNNYKNVYASTVFRYNKKLFLNEENYSTNELFKTRLETNFVEDQSKTEGSEMKYKALIDSAINTGLVFTHKIVNKYCNNISIHLRADSLFKTSGGSTLSEGFIYGIAIEEENSSETYNLIGSMFGVSKSSFTFDIPINLQLNSVKKNSYYIKIIALSQKIPPSNGNFFKEITVSSIIERVILPNSFSYPFTALVRSSVSSNHFNNDPQRSFDLKLLKIKVPKNYDSEIGEYDGNWDGNFDNFLRWTDNPAWIFHDLCTNGRYSISNGGIFDKDLNKWDLYKISKFCDDLILVNTPSPYSQDKFIILDENTIIVNKSDIIDNALTLEDFKIKYPAIDDSTNTAKNGGHSNSIIFLYNLSRDGESIETNFKKIIVSVDEVNINGDTKEITTVTAPGSGSAFRIKLMNDFGPRKFFEKNKDTEIFLQGFSDSISKSQVDADVSNRIINSKNNTESGAKDYILTELNQKKNAEGFSSKFIKIACFDKSLLPNDTGYVKGNCLPKKLNYRDPLEKRFSCNILIDNETEFLKLLNDIASVFRGLTYYKNNFVTSTIDVDKPIAYLFNNSNVKDGSFSYSSGSIDGNYSVAKVMYRDKYSNYDQQVEIVEDSFLVNSFGIVTKEILGFGITSKDQARRIGEWLLMTNRFENQTVNFVTDLQGLILKPSDIIQIEDENKNDSILQGRVTDVDYINKYITIDRKLNLISTGEIIKFIADIQGKTISSLNEQSSVSDEDIDQLDLGDVIDLKIDRIENDKNRIFFDETYNFANFNKIIKSTPFIIQNSLSNNQANLFKIVSISETDSNEYSLFCIKHDKAKYEYLSKNSFEKNIVFVDNAISFADSDSLKEIDLVDFQDLYKINGYTINQVNSLGIDYAFNENQNSLIYKSGKDYYVLTLNIKNLFDFIKNESAGSGSKQKYYASVQDVLKNKGGLLFKITLKNQSIKFKIQDVNAENKNIFLGKFSSLPNILTSTSSIRVYLFDKDNKIIDV